MVDVHTSTPDVPYGKEFVIKVQYALTFVSRDESHLKVSHTAPFDASFDAFNLIVDPYTFLLR